MTLNLGLFSDRGCKRVLNSGRTHRSSCGSVIKAYYLINEEINNLIKHWQLAKTHKNYDN